MTSPVPTSPPVPRPRLLVVAERLPRPDESAGSCRFLAILAHLARAADVDLWVELDETAGEMPLPAARIAADRAALAAIGVTVLPCTWSAFERALAAGRHDVVFFEFYAMAARYLAAVRDLRPSAAVVVDSVDVHFARLASGVALGAVTPQWALDVRADETATYRAADMVVTASADDTEILRAEGHMPPVVCIPTLVTLTPRERRARDAEAVFVGHFHHAPNLDGLGWFLDAAWPRVRAMRPDARLTVIGSYARGEVHAFGTIPGVSVLGYVRDLGPHLDRAAVAIAPLRFGAGMKGKVTDAMAAGLPVVTTSIGAQGLDIVDGRHARVADDAVGFADALVQVFDEPEWAADLGLAGQALVDAVCGPAAVVAPLGAVLAAERRQHSRETVHSALNRRLRRTRLALRHRWVALGRRFATPVLRHGGPA